MSEVGERIYQQGIENLFTKSVDVTERSAYSVSIPKTIVSTSRTDPDNRIVTRKPNTDDTPHSIK
jgi:hypothetical protein